MLTTVSSFGHRETVARLLDAISRVDLHVFAQFDHAAGAREAGMDLPAEMVIVFGSPRAGTPLMQTDPRVGVELPLRILVWDQGGHTIVGYNDPKDLLGSYDLGAHAATLRAMSSLLHRLADDAAGEQSRKGDPLDEQ